MKANITHNGTLKITPENEMESFALNKWVDGYLPMSGKDADSSLHIVTDSYEPDRSKKENELQP